jgi:hypothetical protein
VGHVVMLGTRLGAFLHGLQSTYAYMLGALTDYFLDRNY